MFFRRASIFNPTKLALVAALGAFGAVSDFGAGAALADNIVRVEEDWELVIGQPDPTVDGPQIMCAFSPVGSVDHLFAVVEINHRSQSTFSAGGIQLQVWYGESLLATQSFNNSTELATDGETITWTQKMSLSGDVLTVEVVNGTSTTWGAFGGQGYLKANISTSLTDLNHYNPDVSVNNSGVGFAGNRVQSLTLKEVRLVEDDGDVLVDDNPRVVHQQ